MDGRSDERSLVSSATFRIALHSSVADRSQVSQWLSFWPFLAQAQKAHCIQRTASNTKGLGRDFVGVFGQLRSGENTFQFAAHERLP